MIQTLLIELLVVCASMTTPNLGDAHFYMIRNNKDVTQVLVRRMDKKRSRLTLVADGRREFALVKPAGKGRVSVDIGRRKVTVHLAHYSRNWHPGKHGLSGPRKVRIKDTRGRALWIQKVGHQLYVSSPTSRLTFVIPARFLRLK